jgi:cytoskeleton protein RodZ
MSNFGASFRKAREAAGLPLERIAAETRISSRFLLAIESEDFHLLPGGIFNRGFVRSYAERLGMDPDQAVSDYNRLSATTEEPLDALRKEEQASARKSERSLYPIAALLLLVMIGLYYALNQGSLPSTAEPAPPVSTTQPAAVTEQNTDSAASVLPGRDVISVEPPTGEPTPASPAMGTPVPAPRSVFPENLANPASTTSPLALDVDVKDATWIHVTADGAVVLNDNLQPGSTRRFSAERSIIIKLGNAGGASMKVNGRDIGPLGTSGQVREFRITPDNANTIQG